MKNNKTFCGLFLAILVLLPGCILHVPSYRRQSLRIIKDNFTYKGSDKNVMVSIKQLNKMEKYDLFGDHIGSIAGNKFRVIYVSINNLSDRDYVFAPHGVDLKQISSRDIVKSMKKTSSIGRLALYTVASINPLIFIDSGSPAIIPIALCVIPVLTVISLIGLAQGIKSIVMNKRVKKDVEEKIAHEKVIINSGEQYDGLIFVKSSDYTPQFAVTLHEKDNKQHSITFDVDLRQNEQKE